MKKYGLKYLGKDVYNQLLVELCDPCAGKMMFYREYEIEPFVPCENCLESTVWILYREKVKKEKDRLFLFY